MTSPPSMRATSLLWPYERPSRSALGPWAKALVDCLGVGSRPSAPDIARLLNQAALVFSHLGASEVARWVCWAHLAWAGRGAVSDRRLLAFGLQPWINLGRLEVLTGNLDAGRRHFRLAECMARRESVQLANGFRVESCDWLELVRNDPTLEPALTNAYVVDSIQSWFTDGSYGDALAFAERMAVGSGSIPWPAIHEARVACHIEFGDLGRAIEAAEAAGGSDENLMLVVQLHLSRGLWSAGQAGSARELMARVADRVVAVDWDRPSVADLPRFLRLIETAMRVSLHLGLNSLAGQLARTLLEVATRCGDQVSTLHALAALRTMVDEAGCTMLARQASTLERACDYHIVRYGSSVHPPRAIAPENMSDYSSLVRAVHDVTGAEGRPDLQIALGLPGRRGRIATRRRASSRAGCSIDIG